MTIQSVAEFAAWVGRSPQQVHRWIDDGMPAGPARGKGKIREVDSASAVEWLLAREREKAANPDDGENMAGAALRKARADADLAEWKAAQAANEVIALATVESLVERVMVTVATQLDGLAGRIAATVAAESDAAVCRQLIFDECRRIRDAMAAEFEARAVMEEGAGSDSAAPGEDAGSVGGRVPDTAAG